MAEGKGSPRSQSSPMLKSPTHSHIRMTKASWRKSPTKGGETRASPEGSPSPTSPQLFDTPCPGAEASIPQMQLTVDAPDTPADTIQSPQSSGKPGGKSREKASLLSPSSRHAMSQVSRDSLHLLSPKRELPLPSPRSASSGKAWEDDDPHQASLLAVVRKEIGQAGLQAQRRSVFAAMAGSPRVGSSQSPRQLPSNGQSTATSFSKSNQHSPRQGDDPLLGGGGGGGAHTLENLRSAFTLVDTGGDGTLTEEEVAFNLLPQLGIDNFTAEDVSALMKELDTDGDGELNFREFVQFYELLQAGPESDSGSPRQEPATTGKELVNKVKENKEKQKRAEDAYLTERQIKARQRVAEILYDLPCFAPDFVFRRIWDVVVLGTILYCFIVPMVTAALAITPTAPLIVTDALCYTVNFMDILINCNTAFHVDESFVLNIDRRAILENYLTRDLMPVDVLCALPVDHIVWAGTESALAYRILCCLKVLKILKYPKLFLLTNRGTMDPSFVGFYFTTVPLLRLGFKMAVMGHILALIRMILSAHESYANDEECPLFGRDACSNSAFTKYFYSFFWVWSLLTTQGTIALGSKLTFFYAGCVMFLSLLLQGHVVASMSAIILKSNVEVQNQDAMRGTLAIMRHYRIPELLQQEVLSFQFHSLQQNAAASLAHTLERLPPTMQREVGLYVKVDLVTNVPMFKAISSEGRLSLANCLEQTYAEPYDYIISFGETGEAMYFMMHGFADVIIPAPPGTTENEGVKLAQDGSGVGLVVATIIRGNFFGEVALLKPELKRTASIQALTYCNLFRLGVEDVRQLFEDFVDIKEGMEAEARRRGILDDNVVVVVDDDGDAGDASGAMDDAGAIPVEGRFSAVKSPDSRPSGDAYDSSSLSPDDDDTVPLSTQSVVRPMNGGETDSYAGTPKPLLAKSPVLTDAANEEARALAQEAGDGEMIGIPRTRRPSLPKLPPPGSGDEPGNDLILKQTISGPLSCTNSMRDLVNLRSTPLSCTHSFRDVHAVRSTPLSEMLSPTRLPPCPPTPPPQFIAGWQHDALTLPVTREGSAHATSGDAAAAAHDPDTTRRLLAGLVKTIETGNDRLSRTIQRDVKTYLKRVEDVEGMIDEFLARLEQRMQTDSATASPAIGLAGMFGGPGSPVSGGARRQSRMSGHGRRQSLASVSNQRRGSLWL